MSEVTASVGAPAPAPTPAPVESPNPPTETPEATEHSVSPRLARRGYEAKLGTSAVPKHPADKAAASAAKAEVALGKAPVEPKPETTQADASEAAAEAAVEAREKPPEPTYKVKVSGEEKTVTIQEALEAYSLVKGAHKTFEESAAMRKDAQAVLEAVRDPSKVPEVLSTMGVDFRKLAEDYLYEMIQEEALPPEERLRRANESERQKLEQGWRELEAERTAESQALEAQEFQEHAERSFTSALGEVGLPASPRTLGRMAAAHEVVIRAGHEPSEFTTKAIARQIKAEYDQELRELVGGLAPGDLANYLGEAGVKKVREYTLSQVAGKLPTPAPFEASPPAPKTRVTNERPSLEEVRRRMRGR